MAPTASPATTATLMFSNRARTATVNAPSKSVGPCRVLPETTPTTGERSTVASPARSAATTHATVASRRTGMPSSAARSVFSADARVATPRSVRRRKAPRARATSGTTAISSTVFPLNTTPVIWKWRSERGVCRPAEAGCPENARATAYSPNATSWAMPIVATLSTSRDESKKRRASASSRTRPAAPAAATPTTSAAGQGIANASSPIAPIDALNDRGPLRNRTPPAPIPIKLRGFMKSTSVQTASICSMAMNSITNSPTR